MISVVYRDLYVALYLAASMGLLAVLFVPAESDLSSTGSTPLFMICWSALYATSLLAVLHWRPLPQRYQLWVLGAGLYLILTTLWSIQPVKTLVYAISMFMNLVFVIFVISNYNRSQFLILLSRTIVWLVAIGLTLKLLGFGFVEYYDIHDRGNILGLSPLRGLFNHKITAGIYSAMAFCLVLAMWVGYKKYLALMLLLFFNLMTGSATGVSLLIISVLLLFFVRFLAANGVSVRTFIVSLVLVSSLTIAISYMYLGEFLELLGRDPTLTGRTLLWQWAIDIINEHPYLGWGYLAYNGSELAGNVAESFVQFENYNVPHFHNSYLQLLVEGGLVLFLPFMVFYLVSLSRGYDAVISGRASEDVSILSLQLLIMIAAVFANMMFKYNDFVSMLIVIFISYSFKNNERCERGRSSF